MDFDALSIIDVLNKVRGTSSSKEKLEILKANKDLNGFDWLVSHTYDTVKYTYGLTWDHIQKYLDSDGEIDRADQSDDLNEFFDNLNNRIITGNAALAYAAGWIESWPEYMLPIFKMIFDRDFKIGVSTKTLNKVWPNLISTIKYNRCSVFSVKDVNKHIEFPAFVQLKCDGTYREVHVSADGVSIHTRSGEPDENPVISEIMQNFPEGFYTGEFTIGDASAPDENRAAGNGVINSKNPPYNKIHFTIWDYLSKDEYLCNTESKYVDRFAALNEIILNHPNAKVHVVETIIAENIQQALDFCSEKMNLGLEGTVLKDFKMPFKNGTSKYQYKMKLKVDADLRVIGFNLGTKGTKYENKNKVIVYESDDHKVKGQCSGMSDSMIDEVTKNSDKYIGTIVTIQFNDLTKAMNNDYYALSHPRFVEFRTDKTESDTIDRVLELRDMAKNL